MGPGLRTPRELQERHTVHGQPRLDPRESENRGDEIDVSDELAPRYAARKTGASDHEGHANGLLVNHLFTDPPMLSQEIAVVGGEDDHRPLQRLIAAKDGDELVDQIIDGQQALQPASIELGQLADLTAAKPSSRLRLVFEVRFVERRWARQRPA